MQAQLAVKNKIKDQFTLIQPYAKRVKKYHDDNNLNDFIKFFERNLLSAIKKVHKEEVVPMWAKDHGKYWERSEILICSYLLTTIFEDQHCPVNLDVIDQDGFGNKVSAFVHIIYDHLLNIALDRKWNLSLLHYQIFRDLQGKISDDCVDKRHCKMAVNF
jgi:hypothetical protein